MRKHFLKSILLLCTLIVGSGTVWGQSDYSAVYTSNVTLPTSGTNVSSCVVVISSTNYDGTKLGKSNTGAAASFTAPAGTKYIHLHVAAWNGKSPGFTYKVGVSGDNTAISNITANSGIANNSPFTFSGNPSTTNYYKVITLESALENNTLIVLTSSSERVVFWGVNTEEEEKVVTSLSIAAAPTKTRYEVGEELDMSGFKLDADGTEVTSGYTMTMGGAAITNGATLSSAGKKTITVAYGGKTVNQAISVGAVSGISVTTPPTKTSYNTGDSFDPAGMVVTASLSTGEAESPDTWTKAVTGYTYSPDGALAPANTSVTITYATKTTTQVITVTNVAVTGVSVKASTTIEKGKTETLTPTISPSNATNKAVSWESDNTSVATVTSAGVVTAVAAGTANITVTTEDGSFEATCVVTVVNQKGTIDAPFSVAEVRKGDASGKNNIYVIGYIVGSWKNSAFNPNELVDSNLALADEYDSNTTIPVELSSGSGLRTNWGPASNPHIVNVAKVIIKGNGQDYFSVKAIKGASSITKVAEYIKVGSTNYATWTSDSILNFTGISSIIANVVTGLTNGYTLDLSQCSGMVPAGTGLIISAGTGASAEIPVVASASVSLETITPNYMKGRTTKLDITDETPNYANFYVMVANGDKAEFQNIKNYVEASNTVTVNAGKAYLDLTDLPATAPSIIRITDEENNATNVEAVKTYDNVIKFFENGQLLIKRDGITYDVMGRIVK